MASQMVKRVKLEGRPGRRRLVKLISFVCGLGVLAWIIAVVVYPSYQSFEEKVKNSGNPIEAVLIVVLLVLIWAEGWTKKRGG